MLHVFSASQICLNGVCSLIFFHHPLFFYFVPFSPCVVWNHITSYSTYRKVKKKSLESDARCICRPIYVLCEEDASGTKNIKKNKFSLNFSSLSLSIRKNVCENCIKKNFGTALMLGVSFVRIPSISFLGHGIRVQKRWNIAWVDCGDERERVRKAKGSSSVYF